MPSRCQHYVGAEERVVAYIDMGIIYHSKIEVGVNILAEMNMMSAPVGMKGRLYIAALADFCKHLPQKFGAFLAF